MAFPRSPTGPTRAQDKPIGVSFYDSNEPPRRAPSYGSRSASNYYDHGRIRVWWLDACEPEIKPGNFGNLRFSAGAGREVANPYLRVSTSVPSTRECPLQGETEISDALSLRLGG